MECKDSVEERKIIKIFVQPTFGSTDFSYGNARKAGFIPTTRKKIRGELKENKESLLS